jgi:hypothetical protein
MAPAAGRSAFRDVRRLAAVEASPLDLIGFVMSRKMLRTIKRLAERDEIEAASTRRRVF